MDYEKELRKLLNLSAEKMIDDEFLKEEIAKETARLDRIMSEYENKGFIFNRNLEIPETPTPRFLKSLIETDEQGLLREAKFTINVAGVQHTYTGLEGVQILAHRESTRSERDRTRERTQPPTASQTSAAGYAWDEMVDSILNPLARQILVEFKMNFIIEYGETKFYEAVILARAKGVLIEDVRDASFREQESAAKQYVSEFEAEFKMTEEQARKLDEQIDEAGFDIDRNGDII